MHKLIEKIEGMHALDGVCRTAAAWESRITRPEAVKNALSGTWLGHPLHPALTDLPIGAWTMATAVDLTAGRSGATAARRLIGFGLLATVPTAAAGASDWSDTYGAARRVGLVHALVNVTATVAQAASFVARRRGRRGLGVALSGMGLGITLCTAYLGGHLSYVRGIGVNHTAFQEAVTDWTDVAALSDLVDDRPLRVTPGGVPVVLVRHDGAVHALSATCTHAGGPLDEGELVDGCIRCPWHSSTFRLSDGEVLRGPASIAEPRWDVRIHEDRILVRSTPA